jgi:polyhydroxybutyrate depolymerase
LAAADGTIVAYPDALDGSWNDGRSGVDHPSNINNVDDIAFLDALIDDLIVNAGADPTRVWLAGFSNGAFMTGRAACQLTRRLAGVALISGPGAAGLPTWCRPTRPLPVLLVHGTDDRIVPYVGGTIAARAGHARGASSAVMDIFTMWATTNHCTGRAEVDAITAHVTRVRAVGCSPGSPVVHYRLEGGSHALAETPAFSTIRTTWDFFHAA